MALPGSGQLTLRDIYVELYGSHTTQQAALRSMSSAASKSVPDSISEFYGYSAGCGLSVYPTYLIASQMGGTVSTYVTASSSWVVYLYDWYGMISSYTTSGSGSGWINFSVNYNFYSSTRNASATIECGSEYDYVDICQNGYGYFGQCPYL